MLSCKNCPFPERLDGRSPMLAQACLCAEQLPCCSIVMMVVQPQQHYFFSICVVFLAVPLYKTCHLSAAICAFCATCGGTPFHCGKYLQRHNMLVMGVAAKPHYAIAVVFCSSNQCASCVDAEHGRITERRVATALEELGAVKCANACGPSISCASTCDATTSCESAYYPNTRCASI